MAILSLNEILTQEVLQAIDGRQNVVSKTVMNLTSSTRPGMDRVSIPVSSGLAVSDITSGTRASADAMTTVASVLMLNNIKRVHAYINYADGIQSAQDKKAQFMLHAPGKFAGAIEDDLIAKLASAGSLDFDSASATAGVFSIADIAKAKMKLDQNNIPLNDRYLLVNAEGMELLSSFTEFQNSQRTLSADALQMGVVALIKGFQVIQQESSSLGTGATLKLVAYHKEAVAYAIQDGVSFVEEKNEAYAQDFLALKAIFGSVSVDGSSNLRKCVISCTTATA